MTESLTCVVLETDTAVLSDISSSLGLVDVRVFSAGSPQDVARMVQDRQPDLVLARLRTDSDYGAGKKLYDLLAADSSTESIPVVALYYTEEEVGYWKELEEFPARLQLPVAFPNFTAQFKKVLGRLGINLGSGATPADSSAPAEEGEAVGEKELGEELSEGVSETVLLERRMVIAYAIQLEVLRMLQGDDEFKNADPNELPQVIERVTGKVCRRFSVSKIVD